MKEELKKNRIEIFKRCMLSFVCLFVIVSSTAAWFSNNKKVDANDLSINAETGPSLIIEKNSSGIPAGTGSSVTFADAGSTLKAATHSYEPEGNQTGLIYVINSDIIDVATGLPKNSGQTLRFRNVPVQNSGNTFYKDYTVYIASQKTSMTVNSLKVSLSNLDDSFGELEDYQLASSMDFYLESAEESNYRGTLNLAGLDFTNTMTGGQRTVKTELELVPSGSTYRIPLQTEGYITVIMRCYFDGGLLDNEGKAFVHAEGLELSDFRMRVLFDASRV